MKRVLHSVLILSLGFQTGHWPSAAASEEQSAFNFMAKYKTCADACEPYYLFSDAKDKKKSTLESHFIGHTADQGLKDATQDIQKGLKDATQDIQSRVRQEIKGDKNACDKNPINYAQIGPHCEGIRLADRASELHSRAMTLFITAAAVCGTACIAYRLKLASITAADATSTDASLWIHGGAAACGKAALAAGLTGPSATACATACATAQGAVGTANGASKTALASSKPDTTGAVEISLANAQAAATAWDSAWTDVVMANEACGKMLSDSVIAIGKVMYAWKKAAADTLFYSISRKACLATTFTSTINDFVSFKKLSAAGKQGVNAISSVGLLGGVVATTGAVYVAAVDNPDTISTCGIATLTGGVAVIRYTNFHQARKSANDGCSTIKEQVQSSAQSAGVDNCSSNEKTDSDSTSLPGGASAGTKVASGGKTGVRINGITAAEARDFADFNNPLLEKAATAGAGGDLYPYLNKDGLSEASDLGINTGDIAEKLAQGASPSSVIGGLQGPEGINFAALADGVKIFEDLAERGELLESGVEGSHYSGGGGRGGIAGAKTPFTPLGRAPTASSGKSAELNFAKKNEKPVLDSNDIWHTHYRGSIFNIVSSKLDQNRSRISQLEYVMPFNRVMATEDIKNIPVPPPAAVPPQRVPAGK